MRDYKHTLKSGGFARLKTEKDEIFVNAVKKKLIKGKHAPQRRQGDSVKTPNESVLESIARKTTDNINDNGNILEMLPDIEQAKQVIIATILSPRDFRTVELTYGTEANDIPTELNSAFVNIMEETFTKDYKIKDILEPILEDALFLKGSYPLAILPESSIDDLINSDRMVATEAFAFTSTQRDLTGILGPGLTRDGNGLPTAKQPSLEQNMMLPPTSINPAVDVFLSVADNLELLKRPMLMRRLRDDRVAMAYHNNYRRISNEALGHFNVEDREAVKTICAKEETLYTQRNYQYEHMTVLKSAGDASRVPIGFPCVLKAPPEAIIPIHAKGNPSNHVAYLMLIDEYGNPAARARDSDFYGLMKESKDFLSSNSTQMGMGMPVGGSSGLLGVSKSMNWGNCSQDIQKMNELYESWRDIIEKDLQCRVDNGTFGEGLELARVDEVYRIMLTRMLEQKHTKILFIPRDQMAYFAFDYNEYGIGRSLLDKTKMLASFRSILAYASIVTAVKSSIGRLDVALKLDEFDPDPLATISAGIDNVVRATQKRFPSGQSNPTDIADYLSNAAINIKVTGHEGFPDTDIDVQETHITREPPSTELGEELRKQHLMSLGLSPDIADATMQTDFAASVVSSNVLHAKKFALYQDIYCPQLAAFMSKFTWSSGTTLARLYLAVRSYYKTAKQIKDADIRSASELVKEFLESFKVSLPNADQGKLTAQNEGLENYITILEKVFEAYYTEEMVTEALGDIGKDKIAMFSANMKAALIRGYISREGILPEVADLLQNLLPEGNSKVIPIIEQHIDHITNIADVVTAYVAELGHLRQLRDERIQAEREAAGGEPLDTPSSDPSGDGEGAPLDDADPFAMDDLGGDEPPPEEEPVEEEPAPEEPPADEEPPAEEEPVV